MRRRRILGEQLTLTRKPPNMPIAQAHRAGHEGNLGFHTRLHLGPHSLPDHVLTEQQRTIATEMHVRVGARTKLAAQHNSAVAMNIEHSEALAVECPKNTISIELEPADQMRRLLDV